MVYVIDEGGVFDAPIDVVWKYLQSDDHRHQNMKVLNREVVEGNTVIISAERIINGQTVKTKNKNTLYRPFGLVQEHLEGPTAGSRAFLFYIPKGDKTGVTVVGDFFVKGMDDARAKETILAQMQTAFDEDNANIKKMK
jgi:hypothetical protein